MIDPVLILSLLFIVIKVGFGLIILVWLYKIIMDHVNGSKDIRKPVNFGNIAWIVVFIFFIMFINMEAAYRPTFDENRPSNANIREREKQERKVDKYQIDRNNLKEVGPKVKDWKELEKENEKENRKTIEKFKNLEESE